MTDETRVSPIPRERSPATMALDNLVRRKLRVSDPGDPEAIVKALRERYADQDQVLRLEASGLPYFREVRADIAGAIETTASAEVRQAREDVAKDLDALTSNALLKDVHPELRGWSQTIRQAIVEGINAARFAPDPWQRDRAMAVRRLLGDYARVARYVGALTPNMSPHYRQLAKSLDEVASVILVTMGEALANIGYGGRFLLQAPASELQARRDAVVYALRNLIGTTQEGYGPNDWPRGLVAYRQFLSRLEESGQADLRALFQEKNVVAALDELIHLATGNTADNLRALGATANLNLAQFRRLIMFGHNLVPIESPPLAAFLTAIQLFLEAFSNGASGYRLLFISRPPIVFYGLYGIGGPDTATERLLKLIINRGKLAERADCYLKCDCEVEGVTCQVLLDKVLYDLDRAIDLYTLGVDDTGDGEPEHRAAAYGVVIETFLSGVTVAGKLLPCVLNDDPLLIEIRNSLFQDRQDLSTFSQGKSLQLLHDELCLQSDGESQWKNLLSTMAPTCLRINGAMEATDQLLKAALNAVETADNQLDKGCPAFGVSIPPHIETSFDSLINDVTSAGSGRKSV